MLQGEGHLSQYYMKICYCTLYANNYYLIIIYIISIGRIMFKDKQRYELGNKNNRENVDITICKCYMIIKIDRNKKLTEIQQTNKINI